MSEKITKTIQSLTGLAAQARINNDDLLAVILEHNVRRLESFLKEQSEDL